MQSQIKHICETNNHSYKHKHIRVVWSLGLALNVVDALIEWQGATIIDRPPSISATIYERWWWTLMIVAGERKNTCPARFVYEWTNLVANLLLNRSHSVVVFEKLSNRSRRTGFHRTAEHQPGRARGLFARYYTPIDRINIYDYMMKSYVHTHMNTHFTQSHTLHIGLSDFK